MRTIEDFLRHFCHQRRWTRTIVAAIPEEQFDWSPAPDAFSCGDLVRHMMQVMIEHEAHHRGQLTAYLKMLGVGQPAAVIGS